MASEQVLTEPVLLKTVNNLNICKIHKVVVTDICVHKFWPVKSF